MARSRTVAAAFADAAAAMVGDYNVVDVLDQLLHDCLLLTPADAAAILMVEPGGRLELLGSTSHRATELEMLQRQDATGPCVDAVRDKEHIGASGSEELIARWEHVGEAILGAGFQAVDAYPMRWHDDVLGGLNVFRNKGEPPEEETQALCQAFADVATLVLAHSSRIPADQMAARVREAVADRAQVEQAKGVLAHQEQVDMAEAYERLVRRARDGGRGLAQTAELIVRSTYEPPSGDA
jgi:hypothetical protein